MAVIKDLLSAMISKINKAPKTVNGVEPDENGNIEVVGGASSWNDLTDKPFGEVPSTVITWDGVIGNRPVISAGDMVMAVKISEKTFSFEQLQYGTLSIHKGDNQVKPHPIIEAGVTLEQLQEEGLATSQYLFMPESIMVAYEDNITISDEGSGMSITVPEKGIYVPILGEDKYVSEVTITEPHKTLDSEDLYVDFYLDEDEGVFKMLNGKGSVYNALLNKTCRFVKLSDGEIYSKSIVVSVRHPSSVDAEAKVAFAIINGNGYGDSYEIYPNDEEVKQGPM